jgi:Ca2+-binding RTX toxin-like protein
VATVNVSATDVDTLTDIENATGGGGADALTGDIVANVLSGLGGDDSLNGDDGADTLIGGAGNDVLSGGAGGDTFVFSTSSTLGGSDVVEDFSIADNDRIDFRFGETGELALSGLHGTGAEYAEVAAGEEIGANVGLVVVTSAQTGVLAATAGTAALALGNELLAANNSAFADGDILLLAFSNGTSTFMVRIGDTVNSAGGDSDLAFDSAELLFTLETLSNASELSPSTFIDFAQPV